MTETNLFGEHKPPPDPSGRCSHMNADYRLPIIAHLRVESRYGPEGDTVRETERKLMWTGQVQGTCLDCGKVLYYGASQMPKFVKRRLVKLANLDEIEGRHHIERK